MKKWIFNELKTLKFVTLNYNMLLDVDNLMENACKIHLKYDEDQIKKLAYYGCDSVLTDTVIDILLFVLKKRELGANVIDISVEFSIDPRSTFHYVKTLITAGLV